jgi:hypothetical protein
MAEKTAAQQIGAGVLGAAGTAIAPGIGTAIGGAVGNIIGGLFGGGTAAEPGKKQWQNAPADVRDLWSHSRPQPFEQAFLTWMQANHADKFLNADTVKGLRYTWAMGQDGGAINNAINPNFMLSSGAAQNALFDALGIDLVASQRATLDAGGNPNNIPANKVVRKSIGQPAVDALQAIKDKAERGGTLTGSEKAALGGLQKDAKSGGSMNLGSLLPLAIGALIIYLVVK